MPIAMQTYPRNVRPPEHLAANTEVAVQCDKPTDFSPVKLRPHISASVDNTLQRSTCRCEIFFMSRLHSMRQFQREVDLFFKLPEYLVAQVV